MRVARGGRPRRRRGLASAARAADPGSPRSGRTRPARRRSSRSRPRRPPHAADPRAGVRSKTVVVKPVSGTVRVRLKGARVRRPDDARRRPARRDDRHQARARSSCARCRRPRRRRRDRAALRRHVPRHADARDHELHAERAARRRARSAAARRRRSPSRASSGATARASSAPPASTARRRSAARAGSCRTPARGRSRR